MMPDERLQELISADLDGELDPVEQAELEAALAASAQARQLRAELQKLGHLLDGVPQEEPPADLAPAILAQLRLPRRSAGAIVRGWFAGLQLLPVATAFAAGLLLAVAIVQWTPSAGIETDPSLMVGSMLSGPDGRERFGEPLQIEAPGLSGTVALRETRGFVMVDFALDASEAATFDLALAAAGLGFGGIAQLSANERDWTESYRVAGGDLRVESQGHRHFIVFLRRPGEAAGAVTALDLTVTQQGRQVYSGSLPLASGPD
jgi:predicted anti-sigma-YlaC factor YlaD